MRVSALEITSGPREELRDLLAAYSGESDQSPGVFLGRQSVLDAACELRGAVLSTLRLRIGNKRNLSANIRFCNIFCLQD